MTRMVLGGLAVLVLGWFVNAVRAKRREWRKEAQFWKDRAGARYARQPGCDAPYDFEQAREARRKANARQARRLRLEAGPRPVLVKKQATVTPIRRTQ